jgi:hypothetical protein
VFLALGLFFCTSACDDSDVAWKVQAKSPDGYWLAEADNIQAGGFGDATDTTNIFLTRARVPDDRKTVVISLNPEGAQFGYVQLNWLGKRHLEVVYDGKTGIGFQAIRLVDVDISLRHVDQDLVRN